MLRLRLNLTLSLCFCFAFFLCTGVRAQSESDYYALSGVEIPENIELEVGGMDFLPDGRLAVCTRKGEVWLLDDLDGEVSYSLFARGLHEPLGLSVRDGRICVAQRGEVTALSDENGDGWADRFETLYELPLTGNYHEYHYGPLWRPDGSFMTTLNVGWEGKGVSKSLYRGWMLRTVPGRKPTPYASGMRSPAGFGTNAEGDIFVAENQGDWIGSGRITHLDEGDFAGHPAGLAWADRGDTPVQLRSADITNEYGTMYAAHRALGKGFKLPAVWFPHGILGISTAAIRTDRTEGKFGPFAGQLFVSDQGQSKIMRVALEKVNGEYQGAVFPFREGFSSGLLRLNWDEKGELYAGQTARGWAATGGEEFALEKLSWTGKTPFEMYAIRATDQGFDVTFTEPVRPADVRPGAFAIQNFTYKYHNTYGSPAVDIRDNAVEAAQLLPDGKTVRLTLAGFRPGYIYEVKLTGLRSTTGQNLLHDFGYYTLNAIPGGAAAGATVDAGGATVEEAVSTKRITEMPADWNGDVEADLLLESEKGMRFKQTTLRVKAGARTRLTFRNPDDMQHNFVLTTGKYGNKVGKAAGTLGLKGPAMYHVPEMDEVLAHTRLVEPETDEAIYFTAPEKPGIYEYVCTVPGHYTVMRGVLFVE